MGKSAGIPKMHCAAQAATGQPGPFDLPFYAKTEPCPLGNCYV